MTKPDQATLYILSDAPSDDPLDNVAAATPFLASRYAAIHQVGPGHALSVRALRRVYEPDVDQLLYDFTAPHDHSWAFDMLNDAPAAILRGCYNLAQGGMQGGVQGGALADLRSAQRYAADGLRFSPDATIGVLDAAPASIAATSLPRPAVTITPSAAANDLILAVSPGAIETAYAALLGLKGHSAPLTVLTASRRDANDLTDVIAAFEMSTTYVRYARNRAGLVAAMISAGGLIDINEEAAPAFSDTAFVARCIGAPVLNLTSAPQAGAAAKAFATSNLRKDPAAAAGFVAARPIATFARDLHKLITAGFAHARQQAAAA